jgi:hypothetical protein
LRTGENNRWYAIFGPIAFQDRKTVKLRYIEVKEDEIRFEVQFEKKLIACSPSYAMMTSGPTGEERSASRTIITSAALSSTKRIWSMLYQFDSIAHRLFQSAEIGQRDRGVCRSG